MENTRPRISILFTLIISCMLGSCHNSKETDDPKNKKDTSIRQTVKIEQKVAPNRGPVINILDTVSTKQLVLCIRDSAANSSRISMKLSQIYGVKLAAAIKKNHLKITGPPMAWYKSQQAPFFFEAGFPVDKIPAQLPAGIFIKQIGTDSVVVAHFYGPYDLTSQAYAALQDWMKDHKKKQLQPPYEIYVDDPLEKNGQLKDPYKVQTDVVYTWK